MTQTSLVSSELLAQGFGKGPDFTIVTNAMELDKSVSASSPVLRMVGSSTVRDLQGDTMAMTALQDMTQVPDNLTVWLNHSYVLPDDVMGSLYASPVIQASKDVADLYIQVEVEMDNPAAARTCNMIVNKGRRFGCSIGCQVLDYDIEQDGLIIKHVETVEWSVVGIPACQRCWVENAIYGVFQRALVDGRGDDVLQIAPRVKSLYSREYERILRNVTSKGLASDLSLVSSRSPIHTLLWETNSGAFLLKGPHNTTKSLSRNDLSDLFSSEDNEDMQQEPEDLTTKSATGKTSWPLMDIGTEWTGSKAEKQIFDWARDDNGDIQASKASQCFLYTDPDNNDKQSGYKMPFTYIVDGSPKIVPLGVRACGNVLAGGMGGVQAGGDEGGMKAKVKTMYGRINSEFKPDPEWQVPWEKDEKAAEVETTKDEVLDTESGQPLIRQDLDEKDKKDMTKGEMPKASDVEINKDGSHVACKGMHTHAHKAFGSQGDDEQHEHQHEHDGDANHDHEHADDKEKSADPAETAAVESVEAEKALDVPEQVATPDPQQVALLTAYNTIGKQLGLEPVDLTQKCNGDGYDMQQAVTLISQADSAIDALMGIFGVPDMDKLNHPADDGGSYPVMYSLDTQFTKSFTDFVQKEGRELSDKNRQVIAMMHDHAKSLHDMAKAMHPDACKCDGMGDGTSQQNNGTDLESARQDAKYQMGQEMTASLTEGMNSLAKALSDLNVPHIKNEVETAQKALSSVNKQLQASRQELASLNTQVAVLKNVPLGRPTQLNRSVAGEASYADMRQAIGQPLNTQEVLSQTNIVTLGFTKYRHWPAGVGNGQRPTLSDDQKSLMRADDILNYQDGEESYVPLIEE